MRRIAVIFAILLAAIIGIPASLDLWAQDRSAKGFVEGMLESMLAAEGRGVVIDDVSISITGNVSVKHVEVRDGDDSWLVIDGLALTWQPLSLFRQSLEIDSLTAESIELRRLPVSADSGVAAPNEVKDLTAARIARLHVGKFRIDAAVTGEEMTASLDGSGEIKQTPAEIRLDFTANRTDGKEGRLRAGIVLDPRTRQLAVDIALSEQADGLVAKLLTIAGEPSIDLTISAKGTLDDWSGNLALDLDKQRVIAGATEFASEGATRRLTIDGGGEVGRLVPAGIGRLFAGQSQLVASVLFDQERGRAEIQRIRIDNEVLQLVASGPLDWTGRDSNVALELRAKDTAQAITLAGGSAIGPVGITDMRADIGITGSLASPQWSLAMGAGLITSNPATLTGATVTLKGSGFIPAAEPVTVVAEFRGGLEQGTSAGLPPASLGPLTASLSVAWRDWTSLVISTAKVSAGKLAFSTTGSVDPIAGSFDLVTSGTTQSPATGYELADLLLQGDVALSGRITGDGKGGIGVENARISSSAITAQMSGRLDSAAIDVSLTAAMDNLSLLHRDMAGRAQGSITMKGPRLSPQAVLDATGEDITLLGQPFAEPQLHASLVLNADRPAGELKLSGRLKDKPVNAQAKIETAPDGTKILRDLAAHSGSASVSGELRLPRSGAPLGKFTFSASDLRDVAPFLLTRLAGSIAGNIDLSDNAGLSRLAVSLNARNLASESISAESLNGDFVIDDVLSNPRPEGQFTAAKARVGAIAFVSLAVTARAANANAYSVAVKASGNDLSLDGEAQVDRRTPITATISRLTGKARGVAFAANPFRIRLDGQAVNVENAVLTVGNGGIRLNGRLSPDFDATADITNLPLSPFEKMAGIPGLGGTLSGKAQLAGKASAMDGRFNLAGERITLAALVAQGISPVSFDTSGTIRGSKIALRGTTRLQQDLTATVDGEVDIGAPGRLDIRLRGRTGSRTFADRLAREGIRLEGTADFDLRIAGPFRDPAISGSVTLSKATFGDTGGRFILRNASGRATIADNMVRITSLEGTTGRNGRASMSGTIALDAGRSVNLRARVENGTYTDGTLVNTIYDADIALSGSLAGTPRVSGTVTLKKPKITLSEIPPSALQPLAVRHTHAPAPVRRQVAELRSLAASGGAIDAVLDVTLRAADPISLSGRGLTVTMSGGLKLTGSMSAPLATGAFRLERGSLQLVARRLEFERGRLDFAGDLDPRIELVAVSRRTDATITLTISGRASTPEIIVTSNPRMPQEEALARLMFDRSMVQLSPLQIAQIAGAIATLGGGGSSGLLSRLQSGLGVDWLEVTETETGETAIGIGKRINDRLSLGVEQTTRTNTSRVIIDLNISDNLKVRGGLGTDGSSRAGFFFEKDY